MDFGFNSSFALWETKPTSPSEVPSLIHDVSTLLPFLSWEGSKGKMRKIYLFGGGVYLPTGQILIPILNIVSSIFYLFLLKSFSYNHFGDFINESVFSIVLSFSHYNTNVIY